ncbi:MraY family glycosyltransferase [Thalassospira xiamenensis]|uniref:MraY family glycosyltransferase n=1 Tax=Thalassospira xiamenensis TaxID=220697 RepID=UPI000DEE1771|nr:glycosyltransferase family 4 protein [Thalassospira xiamenensis]MBR9779075.1 glycosyltransferase family 4 protein [Rhodospirillales bacterium]MBR9818436.1 glycosyltransferase family 4 protein [Rhodospirillales bacterium]RCK39411.1 UDP-N-acetylmuramyl pentapeptide phosphotransferase [Thalassospira xiamenensis]
MSFAALAIFSGCFLIGSMLLTWAVLLYLRRKAILDMPNHRSSHAVPTPRGGGLAVTPLLVFMVGAVFLWSGNADLPQWVMLAAAAALGMLSWFDDRHDLSPAIRFACQFVAVIVGVFAIDSPVLQGLVPMWLDRVLVVLAWVWFLNLFNFMDGIDGITGVEAGSIGAGVFVLALLMPLPEFIDLGYIGLGILAIMAGFLIWNWHPAKLFLGDVGSVPLGFVLGWLLLELAARGAWMPALILPLYYLVDATFTLMKRGLRREKVWHAHREHFYQQATQRGMSHAGVSFLIMLANLALILVVFLPTDADVSERLAIAAIIVVLLIAGMKFLPVKTVKTHSP